MPSHNRRQIEALKRGDRWVVDTFGDIYDSTFEHD